MEIDFNRKGRFLLGSKFGRDFVGFNVSSFNWILADCGILACHCKSSFQIKINELQAWKCRQKGKSGPFHGTLRPSIVIQRNG